MHSLSILSFLGVASAAVLSKRDQTISRSVRDPTRDLSIGRYDEKTTVLAGVTLWYTGGGSHNILGNLDNRGSITFSQTDYLRGEPNGGGMTCHWDGSNDLNGNLVNAAGATISVNDFGANGISNYGWYLESMQNRGNLQFCARGDRGGSVYNFFCETDNCYNYGVIDFEQYNDNQNNWITWRSDALGQNVRTNLYNYGAIRMVNAVQHSQQNILGDGCWVIDEGGVLYLEDGAGINQNPNLGTTWLNQKIYFTPAYEQEGRLQTLHLHPLVYRQNSNFGARIYGFGGRKAIEFIENINSYSYNGEILTVVFDTNQRVQLVLGPGYDTNRFYKQNNPQSYNRNGWNAIFYRGDAPAQSVPGQCNVSLGKCQDPANTVTLTQPSSTPAPTSAQTTTTVATTTLPATTPSTTSAPASTTTSASGGNGPCAGGAQPSRTFTTSNGDVYGVCPNTDFPGGDISNPVSNVNSPEACGEACSRTFGCVAGALVRGGNICYLKGTQNRGTANGGVDGIYRISGSGASSTTSARPTTVPTTTTTTVVPPTTTTASPTASGTGVCAGGAPPSSTYVARNGDVYGICLNTDFGGNDITSTGGITSPQALAEACSAQAGCVAGSVIRAPGTGYLKRTRSSATANNGVDSVYKISSGPSSSGSTATTTSVRPTTTVPPTTTAPPATSSGACTPVTVTVTVTR